MTGVVHGASTRTTFGATPESKMDSHPSNAAVGVAEAMQAEAFGVRKLPAKYGVSDGGKSLNG